MRSVPVMAHEGITDEEISRRADEDNENDEYHVEVSLLDVWAEYYRLWKGEGWTQERIASAKGSDDTTVRLRCKLHTDLPEVARKATVDGLIDEGHLIPIIGVTVDVHGLQDWLTTEQAQTELVEEVLSKHRGKTSDNPRSPSTPSHRDNLRHAVYFWKPFQAISQSDTNCFPAPSYPPSVRYYPRRNISKCEREKMFNSD